MSGFLSILLVLLFPGKYSTFLQVDICKGFQAWGCPCLTGLSFTADQSLIMLKQLAQVLAYKENSVYLQSLVHIRVSYIHWYWQQEDQPPQRLLWMDIFSRVVQ